MFDRRSLIVQQQLINTWRTIYFQNSSDSRSQDKIKQDKIFPELISF